MSMHYRVKRRCSKLLHYTIGNYQYQIAHLFIINLTENAVRSNNFVV